jgi:hypothetical protein
MDLLSSSIQATRVARVKSVALLQARISAEAPTTRYIRTNTNVLPAGSTAANCKSSKAYTKHAPIALRLAYERPFPSSTFHFLVLFTATTSAGPAFNLICTIFLHLWQHLFMRSFARFL